METGECELVIREFSLYDARKSTRLKRDALVARILSNAIFLTELNLSFSLVRDIEFLRHTTGVRYIDLSFNQIVSVDPLRDNTSIVRINLSNNRIRDLGGLEMNSTIRRLRVDDNQIESIEPLRNHISIVRLFISNNRIKSIEPLRGNRRLKVLNIGSNKVESIEVLRELSTITSVYAGRCPIPETQNRIIESIYKFNRLNLFNRFAKLSHFSLQILKNYNFEK
jgi:Leucine-rich repeat (LRR) protein